MESLGHLLEASQSKAFIVFMLFSENGTLCKSFQFKGQTSGNCQTTLKMECWPDQWRRHGTFQNSLDCSVSHNNRFCRYFLSAMLLPSPARCRLYAFFHALLPYTYIAAFLERKGISGISYGVEKRNMLEQESAGNKKKSNVEFPERAFFPRQSLWLPGPH